MRWIANLLPVFAMSASPALSGCSPSPPKVETYAERQCRGMPAGWGPLGIEEGELRTFNRLDVEKGRFLWNRDPTAPRKIGKYFLAVHTMLPEPVTAIVVAPMAPCSAVWSVRNAMETTLHCRNEYRCVEYSLAEWRRRHPPLPPCDADCKAYGDAGGSFEGLSAAQKKRLQKNYIDRYGLIPW